MSSVGEKKRLVESSAAGNGRGPALTLQQLKAEHRQKIRRFAVQAMIWVFLYLLSAVLVFMSSGMNALDALLYAIVIMTTVGYGAEVEQTYVKVFIVVFLIVDFCLIANLLSFLVGAFLDAQEQALASVLEARKQGKQDISELQNPVTKSPKLLFSVIVLFVVIGTGVVVFCVADGLGIVDSVYMVAVTVTTTGLGDLVPTTTFTKVFSIFFLPIATLGIGKVLSDYAHLQTERRDERMEQRILHCKIDAQRFFDMDKDNSGSIDKMEFLINTLVAQSKVDHDDVETILARFDEIDLDKSGTITLEEVEVNQRTAYV